MPATVSHALSMTTPDDPAYENKPSNWNSAHFFALNASGSEISGAFNNGGGVTFGLETNGSITAAAPAGAPSPVNFSAGTTSNNLGSVVFSNQNGVSFGLNGSTISASIATTYAGTGFTSTTTAGVAIIGTNNTAGLSLGVPAFLTTAMQSQSSSVFAKTGFSTGATAGALMVGTNNTDGLSLGVPAWITTARASNDGVGLNTAQSNVTWTVGSNGISLDGRGYAGTGTSATNASITLNSNGLQISVADPGAGGGAAISADANSQNTGTVNFSNSNNVSFGLSNNGVMTASFNAAVGTIKTFYYPFDNVQLQASIQANTGMIRYFPVPHYYTGTRIDAGLNVSITTAANNSSAGYNGSVSFVLYTKNGGTLSSISSATGQFSTTWSSNVTASVTGDFFISAEMNANLTPGHYYIALNISTRATGGILTGAATTSLANTMRFWGASGPATIGFREFGSTTNGSIGFPDIMGVYTGTTNLSAPVMSQISGSGNSNSRANFMFRIFS